MSLAFMIWTILGILLVGAEVLIPGLVVIFFAGGALITGLLTLILPFIAQNFFLQTGIWMATSIGSLFLLRRKFAKIFKGQEVIEDHLEYVGQPVKIIEKVSPEQKGRIQFQGTTWDAYSDAETFEPGSTAEILEKEDLHFIITKSLTE